MTPFVLDFVRRQRRSSGLGLALLGAGFALVAYGIVAYRDLDARAGELQSRLGRFAPMREFSRPDSEALRRQIQLAGQIVQRKAIPWDALFRDIESASGKDIGLLAIQPEASGRMLRIDGEARNVASLVAYIERLEERPSLRDVHLISHELRAEGAQRAIRFGVNAKWTPT